MNAQDDVKKNWKEKARHEMRDYFATFTYIALVLMAFTTYRALILHEDHLHFTRYLVPIIKAAILAKIVIIGDLLHLGRKFERKALIVPVLVKTLLFSLWIAFFTLVEHTVIALVHGGGWAGGVREILGKGKDELLAGILVMFVTSIPFFAYREVARVLGEAKLHALLWGNVEPEQPADR